MSTESAEQIEKRAGDWLARRDAHDWSVQEQESFDAWMNASPTHQIAYWRLESVWEDTQRLSALGAGIQSDKAPLPGAWNLSPFFDHKPAALRSANISESVAGEQPRVRKRRATTRMVRLPRALAAGVLLAAAVTSVWYLWPTGSRYETPVGGVATLPMSDGSKVILNTNSEIKVAINETERRIALTRGEAFFDVVKDPGRPFIVTVDDQRVVAIGTRFSVRREPTLQVIVTEGAVRVESPDVQGVKILPAGSIARSDKEGLKVHRSELPQAEEQLAWRTGSLVFRDIPLSNAVVEFNRYNERKIVIEDPAAAALTIGGVVRTTNVDAFVQLLEEGYHVRAELQGDKIILSTR